MDFLGIGPLELFFILIIALIIFGPNDIVKAGKTVGSFMRKVVTSDGWKAFQQARKGMSDLPTTLMREAGIEEEDLRQLTGMRIFKRQPKISKINFSLDNAPTKLPNNPENPVGEPTPEESSPPSAEIKSSIPDTAPEPEEPPVLPSESSTPQNNDSEQLRICENSSAPSGGSSPHLSVSSSGYLNGSAIGLKAYLLRLAKFLPQNPKINRSLKQWEWPLMIRKNLDLPF